jgi:glucokinase
VSGSGYILGADLGGTNTKIVAVRKTGELIESFRVPTKDTGGSEWLGYVRDTLHDVQHKIGTPASRIGISAPGLVAADNRTVTWMKGRMEALEGTLWTDLLESAHAVTVVNDAHAALLGEVWKGPAKGYDNAALLTLGTGVGGALVVDGHLLQGAIGRAGHLGHMSLDIYGERDIVNTPGSLEDAIGNHTIEARSGGRYLSTQALVDDFRAGDEGASEIWLKSIRALACAIAGIINVADPAVVVIGGGIAETDSALFGPLEGFLEEFEWRPEGCGVPIVKASLGDMAGAYGAAYFSLNYEEGRQ